MGVASGQRLGTHTLRCDRPRRTSLTPMLPPPPARAWASLACLCSAQPSPSSTARRRAASASSSARDPPPARFAASCATRSHAAPPRYSPAPRSPWLCCPNQTLPPSESITQPRHRNFGAPAIQPASPVPGGSGGGAHAAWRPASARAAAAAFRGPVGRRTRTRAAGAGAARATAQPGRLGHPKWALMHSGSLEVSGCKRLLISS